MTDSVSQISSRQATYSDITFTFIANPNTGDVGLSKDTSAVKQSVINILNTTRGERPFKPDLGGDLRAYLFEFFDTVTEAILADVIIESLKKYEPRVKVLHVDLEDLSYRNALNIRLEIAILSPSPATTVVEFIVERLR